MLAACCNSHIPGVADNFPESNGLALVKGMPSGTRIRWRRGSAGLLSVLAVLLLLLCVTSGIAAAQVHGIPPSVTSIQNHFPPYLQNIRPSVTSLGPYGYVGPPAFPVYPAFSRPSPGAFGRPFRGRHGYGYGGAYVAPYYIPTYDTSYGYDGGGGAPYLYSGPPAEQTLHIVVDLPAARRLVAEDDEESSAAMTPKLDKNVGAASTSDLRPIEPTVLVFRDGHQQEVSNYAIMGQTVYVFDKRTQKIALSDLDVAATIKLNDDRGIDFHVPSPSKS